MKALSKNNVTLKITLPIFFVLTANLIVLFLLKDYNYFIIISLFFSAYYLKKRYDSTNNVFFNSKFLFLKSKKSERKIDLKQINKIELTLSDIRILGFQYYGYEINFQNEDAIKENLLFYISNLKPELWEFQNLVKNLNKNVKINNKAK